MGRRKYGLTTGSGGSGFSSAIEVAFDATFLIGHRYGSGCAKELTRSGQRIADGGSWQPKSEKLLTWLQSKLRQLETEKSPFSAVIPRKPQRKLHYLKPELVAEIEFSSWTEMAFCGKPL
jgi:hypothetical protein